MGLVGQKRGMTRIFNEDGKSLPVTVIEVISNRITQIKTEETDGYHAIQITMGEVRKKKLTKALAGHYAKSSVAPGKGLWEFRLEKEQLNSLTLGMDLDIAFFQAGQKVDVVGTSKGKGYAGTIKRYHFAGQDATHGNSLSHRAPGSIGQRQSPGKVFKGKKMSGHLGNVRRTAQNLQVVKIDKERNLILIKGAVPGAPGSIVLIHKAVKEQ